MHNALLPFFLHFFLLPFLPSLVTSRTYILITYSMEQSPYCTNLITPWNRVLTKLTYLLTPWSRVLTELTYIPHEAQSLLH
jgi:hypothetical protein